MIPQYTLYLDLSANVQYQAKLLELVATYRGFKVEPQLVYSTGEIALCVDAVLHALYYTWACIHLQSTKAFI